MPADVGPPTGVEKVVYTDVVYGATAYAILVNLAAAVLVVYIAWKLWPVFLSLHARMRPGQFTLLVVGAFVFLLSYVAIRLEEALHAYVQYGATWQVSEHGIFFLTGRLAGVALLALSCHLWTRKQEPGRHEAVLPTLKGRP